MNALILACYNRPEYLARCLDSLSKAHLPELVMMIDDASTDKETLRLFNEFNVSGVHLLKMRLPCNVGIKQVLKSAYDILFAKDAFNCEKVINLDSDAVVKSDFVERLLALYDGKHIVSGFNCNNPKNPMLSEHDGYVMRKHGNGINMLIDRNQYETIIKPALLSQGNWDYNSTNKMPFKIASPSVVQHIGIESSMGHAGADVACDFKLLALPDVTLFGIDAHDPQGIKRAAEICTNDIDFGDVQIITEKLFSGRESYSKFCIADMAAYIKTSHVLIIHPDGYVQNPLAWDNDWLRYDYIGATWWYKDGMNVGNGGFSLRSKKLLDILANLELDTYHPEDNVICRQLRPWLEKQFDIRFAPEEVANKFAIEAYSVPSPDNRYGGQFGFHGYHVIGLPNPPKQRQGIRPQLGKKLQRL